MVIAGRCARVAFYCRMTHSDHDYTRFLGRITEMLDEKYGSGKWKMELYFEIASGADPDRKEFAQLKDDIRAGKVDTVISVRAAMIARDWGQFLEFMDLCKEKGVEVLTSEGPDEAAPIYGRIRGFVNAYFNGEEESCR